MVDFTSSQAEVNGKRRKASSQPSSCSQNTESSSTTPEPTHESSDNEGEAHKQTHKHTQFLSQNVLRSIMFSSVVCAQDFQTSVHGAIKR